MKIKIFRHKVLTYLGQASFVTIMFLKQFPSKCLRGAIANDFSLFHADNAIEFFCQFKVCLLYTSDAADEEDSVDLGGSRIIKKNKKK